MDFEGNWAALTSGSFLPASALAFTSEPWAGGFGGALCLGGGAALLLRESALVNNTAGAGGGGWSRQRCTGTSAKNGSSSVRVDRRWEGRTAEADLDASTQVGRVAWPRPNATHGRSALHSCRSVAWRAAPISARGHAVPKHKQ